MKRITCGDLAKTIAKHFPQVTRAMIKYDLDEGRLESYQQYGPAGWNYIVEDSIPGYLRSKCLPADVAKEVLRELGLNFHQIKLSFSQSLVA